MRDSGELFPPGATVVRRDVFRGRVWSATPKRVIEDRGDSLVLARWPGVRLMGPGAWVASRRSGQSVDRLWALRDLASGHWELAPWRWRETTVLTLSDAVQYYSVELFFGADGALRCWYVNFELPFRRTGIGIDTFDLLLDLVVAPDLSYAWKDEEEYRHARRLGIVGDGEHARVQQARAQVVELIEQARGPFSGLWRDWAPDPSWPSPRLPRDWLTPPSDAARAMAAPQARAG